MGLHQQKQFHHSSVFLFKLILKMYLFFIPRLNDDNYIDVILTYKNIDKKTFFSIPSNFKSIDDIITELSKSSELNWPCSIEKEVKQSQLTLLF